MSESPDLNDAPTHFSLVRSFAKAWENLLAASSAYFLYMNGEVEQISLTGDFSIFAWLHDNFASSYHLPTIEAWETSKTATLQFSAYSFRYFGYTSRWHQWAVARPDFAEWELDALEQGKMLSQAERESAELVDVELTSPVEEVLVPPGNQSPSRFPPGEAAPHDQEGSSRANPARNSRFLRYKSDREFGKFRYLLNEATVLENLDESYAARVGNRLWEEYGNRAGRSRSQGANDRMIEILLDLFGRGTTMSQGGTQHGAPSRELHIDHDHLPREKQKISYVEFGFETGSLEDSKQANTLRLWAKRKKGLLLDARSENKTINLHQHYIDSKNIARIFEQHGVPLEFDFLSIDVDSYDLFLLEAILKAGFRPTVISTEYNPNYPVDLSIAHVDPALIVTPGQKEDRAKSTGKSGTEAGASEADDEKANTPPNGPAGEVAALHAEGRQSVPLPKISPIHLVATERLRRLNGLAPIDDLDDGKRFRFGDCSLGSSASALRVVAERFGYVLVGIIRHLDLFWLRKDVLDRVRSAACGVEQRLEFSQESHNKDISKTTSDTGGREGSTSVVSALHAETIQIRQRVCDSYFRVPPFEYFFVDLYATQQEYQLLHAWPAYHLALSPLRRELVDLRTFEATGNATTAHAVAKNKLRMRDQILCFKDVYPAL
ncbi:unnamed protein product [Amoebophrya sp. A120]|nr:unnamed protein product [Amoebophrya sp. A120]|eukprot:GSA120T00004858001.1